MSLNPLAILYVMVFFLLACLIVSVPLEGGYHVGMRKRLSDKGAKDESVGVIVGSILALLAFLLAFTFNLAAARYEARRQVVLEEANDIGTTYLRTSLLPEPPRSEVQELLRKYVNIRVEASQSDVGADEIIAIIDQSEQILEAIWDKTMNVALQNPDVMTSLFIQSLNKTIDTQAKRVMVGARSQIPLPISLALLALAIIAHFCAGYQSGISGKKRSPVILGLILSFALVLTMIVDMDIPNKGLLQTMQTSMEDLQETVNRPSAYISNP
ncbi:bestrophin-like domain [Desulfopila inferna]|uniref:bestrophin-like domain n=1 Tax=Desulfopila inferna TaxID=468528 RepID=UPI0019666808|nr:hypothetical protein [Desulfopila inferna]MBM9604348.1 hypothetical protein [Desulfopila inferna]